MAHAALAFLLLLGAAHLAAAAVEPEDCPAFDCTSVYYGKFVDPSDPSEEADINSPSGIVLKEANVNTGTIDYYYPSITDGFKDPYKDCEAICIDYNKNAAAKAGYWEYSDSCDEGEGGTCRCIAKWACDPTTGKWYSQSWQEEAVPSGPSPEPAVNITVGKICDGEEKGDPHFTGADGSHFDFSGEPNRYYALVSDAHVQVNAFFGGRYDQWGKGMKALTWMREVAVLWGHHSIVLTARSGADAAYGAGYLQSVTVDGEAVTVPPKGSVSLVNGEATVEWTGVRERSGDDEVDVYEVAVGSTLLLKLTLRPEVANLRTNDDAVVHFSLDVVQAKLSSSVHGVLGQTFRPDFFGRLAQQKLVHSDLLKADVVEGDNAEGFIDGVVADYQVGALLKADCSLCRFARLSSMDEETARAVELVKPASAASLSLSHRKFLLEN